MKDREGYERALKGVSTLDKEVLEKIDRSTFGSIKKPNGEVKEENVPDVPAPEKIAMVSQNEAPLSASVSDQDDCSIKNEGPEEIVEESKIAA